MAEYCIDCFNKYLSEKKVSKKDVITSYDLCEGCGEWKKCVIVIKKKGFFAKIKEILLKR